MKQQSFLFLFLIIFFYMNSYSQIRIRETINLNQKTLKKEQKLKTVLFRKGGIVVVDTLSLIENHKFCKKSSGPLIFSSVTGKSHLGEIPQWSELCFYVEKFDSSGNIVPEERSGIYHRYEIEGNGTNLSFYELRGFDGMDTLFSNPKPRAVMKVELTPKTASDRIPGKKFLDIYGNPFKKGKNFFIAPADGVLKLDVKSLKTESYISIYCENESKKIVASKMVQKPSKELLVDSVKAGDKIYLSIKSGHQLVSGIPLYARENFINVSQDENKRIIFSGLYFESDTDLHYDNLSLNAIIEPFDSDYELQFISTTALKPELYFGDTTSFSLKKVDYTGGMEDFADDVQFNIEVVSDGQYGYLYDSQYSGEQYLDFNNGKFHFVADKKVTDTVNVRMRISKTEDFIITKTGKSENNNLKKTNDIYNQTIGYCNLKIIPPEKIMLGETKYFQMLRIPKAGIGNFEYKIREVKKFDTQGNPQMDLFGVKANVWGDNPVKVISGGKSGIFYDKFVADIGLSGTTTKPVVSELKSGLIRVVGRYWEEGKTYSTELTAKIPDSDISAKATIEVIKPDKLGDKYNRIYDFPDKAGNLKEWNLDSLIISFAGKEGIMPQIVKGIIRCESVIQKGTSKIKPSYRYEIFSDGYGYLRNYGLDSTSIYWIKSEVDEGNPPIPNHGEVWLGSSTKFDKYPGYQTGWEFLQKYKHLYYYTRKEVDDSYTDSSLVGVCLTAYKTQNKKINTFREKFEDELSKKIEDQVQLKDTIRTLIHNSYEKYLKDSINVYGEGGLSNMICQTRLFASYGLMQLTYNSGTDIDMELGEDLFYYPPNDKEFLPEFINVPDINIKYGILHLKYKLRQFALGKIKFKETDTWDKNHALEKSYWIALRKYNGKYTYPNKVFSFSKLYVPLMNKEK